MRKYLSSFAAAVIVSLMLTACGGGDSANDQQPSSPVRATTPTAARTSTPAPTPTPDNSILEGSTQLEVVSSDSNRVGYTLDFDWLLQDPGKTKVAVTEGDALGTNDLTISFESAMQFGNTTKGNRTFFLQDDGGVGVYIRYPADSPVCKYSTNWAADKQASCFVDTWDGSIVGIRFKDFPTLNDITEGQVTKVLRTKHELILRDVPEAETAQASAAALKYERVVLYMHYGDTADKFKSSCAQSALENLDYASVYVPLGAVGATDYCKV